MIAKYPILKALNSPLPKKLYRKAHVGAKVANEELVKLLFQMTYISVFPSPDQSRNKTLPYHPGFIDFKFSHNDFRRLQKNYISEMP
jgi:hypothetical protein